MVLYLDSTLDLSTGIRHRRQRRGREVGQVGAGAGWGRRRREGGGARSTKESERASERAGRTESEERNEH